MKKQLLFLSLLSIAHAHARIIDGVPSESLMACKEETISKKTIYTLNKLYLDAIYIHNDTRRPHRIAYTEKQDGQQEIRQIIIIEPGIEVKLGVRIDNEGIKQKLFIAGKEVSFTPRCVPPGHVTTGDIREASVKVSELS